ncbi:MAG TPA: hypothetical protein EYN06_02970 [Myxococcales bacterium]|nr:hypothetical protein [Myxococcales bacterium]HIN85417.1 hypothetical protein [Myxococcales bacterium]
MSNGQLLNTQIDQDVTLSGKAFDAMLGAVVVLDDRTPVYVSGVTRWDSATHGQSIEASGTLRKRSLGPDPVTDDDGGISHGIAGTQFVLENAQWTLAN